MAELNGLPVFYIKCNENPDSKLGMDFISLVDCPAIETNWVALANEKKPMKFSVNEDKQLLYGPILIPDLPIYRNDSVNGEHYVVFTSDEIQKLVRKFQLQQKTINLNFQHQENSQINSAVIQEIWLTGKKDKSQDLGFDLPANTAFVCAFIGDNGFWNKEVKSGNVKGFSIEGFLDMEMKSARKFTTDKKKFEVYQQADGGSDVFIDGPVAVDNYVFSNYPSVVLKNGVKEITQYPVWQELLVLSDGTILTLKDSKIIKVETKTTQTKKHKMAKGAFSITAKATDGTVVNSDDTTLDEGVIVTTVDKDGKAIPVPDGDYTFDNGDKMTVVGGVITAYVDADSTDDMSAEEVAALRKAFGIDALEAQIKELRIKLKIEPAAAAATTKNDATEPAKTEPGQPLSKFDHIRNFAANQVKNKSKK